MKTDKFQLYLKRIYLFMLIVFAIRVLNCALCSFLYEDILEWGGLYVFLNIPLIVFILFGGILLALSKAKNRLWKVIVAMIYLIMGCAVAWCSFLFHAVTILGFVQEIAPSALTSIMPELAVCVFAFIFLCLWLPALFKAMQRNKFQGKRGKRFTR